MESRIVKKTELKKEILRQVRESAALKSSLLRESALLLDIAELIVKAFRAGHKVLLFGNGGSAADAQHIAAELSGKFYLERAPLPALALTANTSALTAIANDYAYEDIFARQVRGLAQKGDIVIGISTSGNSPNVLKGIREAKRKGAITVVFTGQGGKLGTVAAYSLTIPSNDTPRIQETHILAGHLICYLIEDALFSGSPSANTISITMEAKL
jgi:D-sedoheptulose 7-phosphate isomerase